MPEIRNPLIMHERRIQRFMHRDTTTSSCLRPQVKSPGVGEIHTRVIYYFSQYCNTRKPFYCSIVMVFLSFFPIGFPYSAIHLACLSIHSASNYYFNSQLFPPTSNPIFTDVSPTINLFFLSLPFPSSSQSSSYHSTVFLKPP